MIKYKGWEIRQDDDTRKTFWLATSPNYDVDCDDRGFYVSNGVSFTSYDSIEDLKRQIDCFEEEFNENLID